MLATAPLGDPSSAGRRLVLNTIRYLQVRGDSHTSRPVSEEVLSRWRAILSPDHPDTLTAAISLTLALIQSGEAEPARALSQDTLQRARRVLGPDHAIVVSTMAALTHALNE